MFISLMTAPFVIPFGDLRSKVIFFQRKQVRFPPALKPALQLMLIPVTDYLNKWRGRLSNAEAKEFDCGHFVQEENNKESIALIREFLGKP